MSANAIMFATPIVKVYNILLLTADELSEVLAFIFLGPARPTEEDFMRTPTLVRQDRVKDALDWLKLNHVDYEDLEISKDNIEALPENGIPCGVDWIETNEGDSNTVPKAMAVHDNGEEEGMESGLCSFAVSGQTGDQYDPTDIKTLKAKALSHLKSKGKTLGVGQAEEPESMYHNLHLYPQMFPWLFPYSYSGFGYPVHKKVLLRKPTRVIY
ncbi:hypothetical protein B0H10DRAFT_1846951 [Mycena sp. CBHHK59/15]|nr:hypothetical protein B0H10DRAFT_1846951 [Mycena sp. CBHHK59/15]